MFSGTLVALVTPFRDGNVDFGALDELVDFQLEAGVDGLVPCGTTGESPTLSHEEHEKVIEAVVRRAKGKTPVIAGTGSNSTAEAIRLTKHAREAGADGALLVSPYYNKPTQEGLYQHFSMLADQVEIPQIIYNIPGRCGVKIEASTLARLAAHKNVVGLKEATGSMDEASAVATSCDLTILSGDDSMTLAYMAIGGTGVISVIANIVPKDMKALTDAMLNDDLQTARQLHLKTFALAKGMLALETNPIPVKTAMAIKGMIREEFRLPLCPIQPSNRTKLETIMKEYGLL
jgi:4-hydroxy-tetrahydrodipicolinate synthase